MESSLATPFISRSNSEGDEERRNRVYPPNSNDNNPILNGFFDNNHRILDRDGNYFQSRGHWGVARISNGERLSSGTNLQRGRSMMRVYWGDWFHNIAYRPTLQLMAIIFFFYTVTVFAFAYLYLGVSLVGTMLVKRSDPDASNNFCGMDITNHMEALYFSMSTMTTIGYGVSDYYFGDCWTPLLLVLWQSCCAITFQSIAIGLLFQRISRGQKRGKTIVFSDKATVRLVKGTPHVMFRVGELRKHSLIEVRVRCYCLKHERYLKRRQNNNNDASASASAPAHTYPTQQVNEVDTAYFLTRHMKLCYPDEALGSHILMCLPQVIVHRIDDESPLKPSKPIWYDQFGRNNDYNDENTSSLEEYFQDREIEIIVQVEGTDELTGQTLQARHSYRYQDIAWNCTFAPCVEPRREEENSRNFLRCRRRGINSRAICNVDFSRFHDIVPLDDNNNEEDCPYVPT